MIEITGRSKSHLYAIVGVVTISSLTIYASRPLFGVEKPEQKTAQVQAVPEKDYLLSPSDEIEIKVEGEEDLTGIYKINNEGYIVFPLLGRIKLDELTLSEAESKVTGLLEKDYFKTKALVSIQIKKFHRMKVVLSGEVRSPGSYEFEEGKNLTISEVISLAGGPTEEARLNATTVIRPDGEGKYSTFKVKAGDIMEAKEADIELKPGDRINIPSASFIIMGEVAKPGKYDFGDMSKMTVLGAISMAGGFSRIANIDGVKIIRLDEYGNKKTIRIKVNNIYKGRDKDIALEADDIIVVPESWF